MRRAVDAVRGVLNDVNPTFYPVFAATLVVTPVLCAVALTSPLVEPAWMTRSSLVSNTMPDGVVTTVRTGSAQLPPVAQ